MKRFTLLLLSMLFLMTFTIAGPLQSSVIDEAPFYLDVGHQADNVTVEAVTIEVQSQNVISYTAAYCIATQAVSVESGINVMSRIYHEPGWDRQGLSFTELTTNKSGTNRISNLARSPRDAL